MAPFWKGLNDHSDSWAEHQLVAAVRGLPIPAADEILPGMERTGSQMSADAPRSDSNVASLTLPISGRSQSYQSEVSANLSASHPAFSGPASPNSPVSTSMPLFRGRSKTLASLTTSSRNNSNAQLTPQEVQLPKDPNVNGQPVEAYLYKDASECPICFLYYPPFLNKTRCCDQPICSECFVQIKRPDPHPPEHHEDPSNPPSEPKPQEEEGLLVSEPSACPFCVTQEFGVTYDPPPFRRGLSYAGHPSSHPLANATSAMSSSSSLGSMGGNRRRTTSLSASAPTVITTDRVRPDWAKKLSDARAHALRRSAAATALHNAAYVLGNVQNMDTRGFALGRRRRNLFGDSPSASGSGTPRMPENVAFSNLGALLASADRRESQTGNDLVGGRTNSRRNRVDDLEELMMMEAIRLSLAAEEERSKKEEKLAHKEAKKRAKEEAKEAKKQEKAAKKTGSLYPASTNESTSTWASASMARSSSNLGQTPSSPTPPIQGKGKAPAATMTGFNPLNEPTSTLNTEVAGSSNGVSGPAGPQQHLQASRAILQQPSQPIAVANPNGDVYSPRSHLRQMSSASSINSSIIESGPGSLRNEAGFGISPNASGLDISGATETPPTGASAGLEPMFNFRSLAAMIGEADNKSHHEAEHVEHAEGTNNEAANHKQGEHSPTNGSSLLHPETASNRSRGDSGESSSSGPPPVYVEHTDGSVSQANADTSNNGDHDGIHPVVSRNEEGEKKHVHNDVQVLDAQHGGGIMQ